jgi:chromosomal replication initiation ATPase DnaA
MFGTTPEAVLSAERSRPVSDARAVAMTAAREVGLSLPVIAEQFSKDHGSVIHAVRRTAERPRLADAAARVSEQVNDRYTARLSRPEAAVVSLHQDPPASTFEPDGPVEQAVVAAAEAFGTTPEVLLGTDRNRAAADPRAVAMTAARIHGHSLPTIARHFDRDHTVLHATRRIEKTPPLRDLSAKIAAELSEEPAGAGTSAAEVVEQIPEPGYRSPGARAQERAVPVAGERPQLRVAR